MKGLSKAARDYAGSSSRAKATRLAFEAGAGWADIQRDEEVGQLKDRIEGLEEKVEDLKNEIKAFQHGEDL